jgi:hypothetical protein
MFQSAENNFKDDVGPGYYSVEKDLLNKQSFNVRASKGKESLSPKLLQQQRTPSTPRGGDRSLQRGNSFSNVNSTIKSTTPRSSTAPRRRIDFTAQ